MDRMEVRRRDGRDLRQALPKTDRPYTLWRRGIVLTSFGAGLCMMVIGLYQTGITRRLHEPRWSRLKSSRIAAAPAACRPLGLPIPDSLLGLVSYALTAALAGFGEPDRHRRLPWIVLLMSAKVAADAALGAVLLGVQWAWFRAFCLYCVTASALSFVAAALAVPETRAALRQLRVTRSRGQVETQSPVPLSIV